MYQNFQGPKRLMVGQYLINACKCLPEVIMPYLRHHVRTEIIYGCLMALWIWWHKNAGSQPHATLRINSVPFSPRISPRSSNKPLIDKTNMIHIHKPPAMKFPLLLFNPVILDWTQAPLWNSRVHANVNGNSIERMCEDVAGVRKKGKG